VRSFQQKTGLEVTGIVDDQTWSSLREAAELEPA
jgi:peptidoglycan hydrolase-like protein with peptidoglycan-binding domain